MSNEAQDQYILARGFGANTRINLQYYLWKESLGYVLHPSIPIKENMRVADVGSGTGIWLIELSKMLPSTARLDALDVSHEQLPGQDFLPSNLHSRIFDCLSEPAEDLIGVYDVIHVQSLITVVRDNDSTSLTSRLLKMLKPNGHLVWGEYDYSQWKTETSPGAATDYDDDLEKQREFIATLGHTRPANGFVDYWTARLPETFAKCGMQDIVTDNKPFGREMSAYLLDTFMVATWEISLKVMDPLGGGRGETLRKYIEAVGRNRKHVGMGLNRIVVVGRKPGD